MNKIFKTILLISIAVFSAAFLLVLSVNAQSVDPLIVEWSADGTNWQSLSGPIFNETNFLPGDGVTRLIRVTNNSGQTQRIATEAINETDSDNLASQLNLTIKEGGTIRFNNTLKNFFDITGETYLSDLANGVQTQYDLTVSFNLSSGDDYQEEAVGFDILIGFQGTGEATGGGTGFILAVSSGDSGSPQGLTILDESINVADCCETTATIIWTTSYQSTSQVIYSAEGQNHTLDLNAPNYGYTYSKEGDDSGLEKVTGHRVTITGLLPNTNYYYRPVSHASPATISLEYSFKTPSLGTCLALNETGNGNGNETGNENGGTNGETGPAPTLPGESFPEELTTGGASETQVATTVAATEEKPEDSNKFLAAISSFFKLRNLLWLLIIIALILIFLFFLRKKKRKDNEDE